MEETPKNSRPWDLFRLKSQKVSEELFAERIEICRSCEFFMEKTSQCKKCFCFMNAKAKLPHSFCPEHKWPAVILE